MPVEEIKKKARFKKVDVDKIESQWDVKKHQIFANRYRYPDRTIKDDYKDPVTGETKTRTKSVPLTRIGLPYQKEIVKTGSAFFCGIPIKYSSNNDDEIYDSFQKFIDREKLKYYDKKIYEAVEKWTECATLIYTTEKENNYYGFESGFKLNLLLLTPDENKLYPEFDDFGKMVRFSREYESGDGTKTFETYTDDYIDKFEKQKDKWVLVSTIENPINKIPISYYSTEHPAWYDVQEMIERLEEIYSNVSESNDRFAFPLLILKGRVQGQITKDRSGKVLELSGDNGDAKFAIPPNAAENLNDEIKRLERDIYDFTKTPNITPEKMQGLGNMLSGIAMKYFFMSAHLKVMEKEPLFVNGILRRVSIIEEYLKLMNSSFRNQSLDVDPIITPYIINNEEDLARYLMEVTAGQPLISQRKAMELFGIENADEMLEEIQDEANSRADQRNADEFIF